MKTTSFLLQLAVLLVALPSCQQSDKPAQVSAVATEATSALNTDLRPASPYAAFADSLASTKGIRPADAAAARALATDVEAWQAADRPAAIKQHPAVQEVFAHNLEVLRLAVRARPIIPTRKGQDARSHETVDGLFTSKIEKQAQARKELLVITMDGGPTDLAGAASTIEKASQVDAVHTGDARRYWRKFIEPFQSAAR